MTWAIGRCISARYQCSFSDLSSTARRTNPRIDATERTPSEHQILPTNSLKGEIVMTSYDTERMQRLREDAWLNCAKCGKEVRESEWVSLCNECGDELEEADAAREEKEQT